MYKALLRERRTATAAAVLSALVLLASLAVGYLWLDVPGVGSLPDGEKLRAVGTVRILAFLASMIPLNFGVDCLTTSLTRRVQLRHEIERNLAEDVMLS